MAVKLARLSGTLSLGSAPGLDVSAQVVGVTLTSDMSTGDALVVLTGEQVTSGVTTESALTGVMILDPYSGGVGAWSWTNHGTEQAFSLMIDAPDAASGIQIDGVVVVSRLAIGGEAHGAVLQPEFEWTVVGQPSVTWPAAPTA